jgi:hypothetical protein
MSTSILTRHYGPAAGPLGFPMLDRQAFALDAILKALPKDDAFAYRKSLIAEKPSEVLPGERSDVSWITTEDPDRTKEVVLARGLNDSQFRLNPIVTLQHQYHLPPVARSLWRKVVRDGERRGVKAKSQYPTKPADWQGTWPADVAFSLVQADLLRGKSIGFLPTKVHSPKDHECEQQGWADVSLVIDEWILLEYACTFLKGNPKINGCKTRQFRGVSAGFGRGPPYANHCPAGRSRTVLTIMFDHRLAVRVG